MKIEVTVTSLIHNTYLQIDCDNNKALLNGKPIKLDIPFFVERLKSIVSKWEKQMINPLILDGISYSVTFEKNGVKTKYSGMNQFPRNYGDFTKLLKDNGIL